MYGSANLFRQHVEVENKIFKKFSYSHPKNVRPYTASALLTDKQQIRITTPYSVGPNKKSVGELMSEDNYKERLRELDIAEDPEEDDDYDYDDLEDLGNLKNLKSNPTSKFARAQNNLFGDNYEQDIKVKHDSRFSKTGFSQKTRPMTSTGRLMSSQGHRA